jgi:hypothetical protein
MAAPAGPEAVVVCPYGFRIVGGTWERRQLVLAADALRGYAGCDSRVDLAREVYLSAFRFGADFRRQLEATGTCRDFTGPCWADWAWWDVDREGDLPAALRDARALASCLVERYPDLLEDDLLLFFSGSKGFHAGLPTSLWRPEASAVFNRAVRLLALAVAEPLGIGLDRSVYDKVRPFRAPNSRHPKTGLYKRRLSFDELLGLSLGRILRLAEAPEPFDVPGPGRTCDRLRSEWEEACRRAAQAAAPRPRPAGGPGRLNRQTFLFIQEGADVGDRHRLLYSAARNLGEFDCNYELAWALLGEAALDSGLPPKDVRRQIECGLADAQKSGGPS